MRNWMRRLGRLAVPFGLLLSAVALARVGGGQHYSSGHSYGGGSSGGGGGDLGFIVDVVYLTIRYPQVMCPLIVVVGLLAYFYNQANNPTAKTQRAFEEREAELRTTVSNQDVVGWVNALKLKDSKFELQPVLDKAKKLFVVTQEAWFKRNLAPVRPFLSDAMFQRLATQLKLLSFQGTRNAIADVEVLDIALIGLDQSQWYDTVHLRVKAQMRDADVPENLTDAQARAEAAKVPAEPFVEVWSFVRKPGAQSKIGEDLFQGKCPNCGAPFKGGAANNCEFCGAVVNSGNYDWTLSEITQGIEHIRYYATVDGLLDARASDPALNLEMLQDRASLIFWKWVDAESHGEAKRLAKLATPSFLASLDGELSMLTKQGRRKVFLECAVGSCTVRMFRCPAEANHEAHVELRWSARLGVGPAHEKPPNLPTVPQRWMFTLVRKPGAKTNTATGMSTSRCPNCNAPLSDTLSSTCDFCGTELSAASDWVLQDASSFERWNAIEQQRYQAAVASKVAPPPDDAVLDAHERERLLYMMAAIAAADGVVTDKERKMLELFAKRWSIPWSKVEMALSAGDQLFDRLMPSRGTPEAEHFLRSLVSIALVDGRIDRQERRMLESAAERLGMTDRLRQMLGRA